MRGNYGTREWERAEDREIIKETQEKKQKYLTSNKQMARCCTYLLTQSYRTS